ncbi:MAG: ParB/RepB/Spo0J family partition protein [Rickettsiaceae bacterium]|nr:ParB/RepB/Spo0J family partition protein [Rickettsiaceae bacterium]
MKTQVLGRGLSSLLKEEMVPLESQGTKNTLKIEEIEINSLQPRKKFDEAKIQELADSITSKGLVQPIIVNKQKNGKYKIIAGERRYRACITAGLQEISVIIKELSDKEVLEIALIENIQRQDLTAIEEAEGFQKLIAEYGYTRDEIAGALGKSSSHVANLLRLNQLPNAVKDMVNNKQLTMGHVRCLVGLEDATMLAEKIVANDLNVRQTEELTRKLSNKNQQSGDSKEQKSKVLDGDMVMLGQTLSEKYGIKVVVENSWNGGKISFHYSNLEELDLILTKLG